MKINLVDSINLEKEIYLLRPHHVEFMAFHLSNQSYLSETISKKVMIEVYGSGFYQRMKTIFNQFTPQTKIKIVTTTGEDELCSSCKLEELCSRNGQEEISIKIKESIKQKLSVKNHKIELGTPDQADKNALAKYNWVVNKVYTVSELIDTL